MTLMDQIETTCFLIEPTGREKVYLRRYAAGECPSMPGEYSYHQNRVYIGARRIERDPSTGLRRPPSLSDYTAHPRWPLNCVCGVHFTEDDRWQVAVETLYSSPFGEVTIRDVGPGAIWDATWLSQKGQDGRSLVVKLPDGSSLPLDLPSDEAEDGGGWERSGEAPLLTAEPAVTGTAWVGSLHSGQLIAA